MPTDKVERALTRHVKYIRGRCTGTTAVGVKFGRATMLDMAHDLETAIAALRQPTTDEWKLAADIMAALRRAKLDAGGDEAQDEFEALTLVPMLAALRQSSPKGMTDEQIKHMTERFLSWRLPENFHPDCGISFVPEFNVEWNAKHGKPPQRHEPTGTNLFDAEQAEAMVRHMIEALPESPKQEEG